MRRLPRRAYAPLRALALTACTGPVVLSFEHERLGFSVDVHRPVGDGRCWYTVSGVAEALGPYPMLAMLAASPRAFQAYATPEDAAALTEGSPVLVMGNLVAGALMSGRPLQAGHAMKDSTGRRLLLHPVTFPSKIRAVSVLAVFPEPDEAPEGG